ncbi:cell division protein FtsL [Candidatus Contubernalis alkaliaceticus]|uniref:cell division protein FtsL n=1 Tax=Candidatus Contubernalis alkaliaceticus TaxID=338645 RepID=UPI001F4C4F47|nr:cell division protein FtsL [Candidatus Contubernalis alkalaceticus]UNC92880.1 cell division protein FtsL [Candidatus Contubernalis alkalaceticus]
MLVAKQRQFQYQTDYKGQQDYQPQSKIKLKNNKLLKIFCFLSLFILLGMAITLVSHYNRVIAINNQIIQHERQLNALNEEQESLKIQIAQLSTLRRIEDIAINEIGMYYPQEGSEKSLVATTN